MSRALPSLALLLCLCLAAAPVSALPMASIDSAAPAPDCAAGRSLPPDAALAAILAPPASPDGKAGPGQANGDRIPLSPAPRNVDTIVDCDSCPTAYRQCFRQCRSYGLCDYSCSAIWPSCELASCLCTPC